MILTSKLLKGKKYSKHSAYTGRYMPTHTSSIFVEVFSTGTNSNIEQFIDISSLPYKTQIEINEQITNYYLSLPE